MSLEAKIEKVHLQEFREGNKIGDRHACLRKIAYRRIDSAHRKPNNLEHLSRLPKANFCKSTKKNILCFVFVFTSRFIWGDVFAVCK